MAHDRGYGAHEAAPQARAADEPHALERLSPRQRELIEALALGLGNRAIADRLGLGEETVKSYLKELYARIGVSSRADAVAWGIRNGLID